MFTESAVPNQTKPVPAKKSKVDSQVTINWSTLL